MPLDPSASLPAFPVGALPSWAADMVQAVAESVQVPPDSPGTVCLGALASAVGGHALVQPRADWVEQLNLYLLVTAGSSERKSPVMRAMRAPLTVAQRQLVDLWAPEAQELEVTARIAQAQADQARKAAGNAEDEEAKEAARDLAVKLARDADSISIPVRPRLVAGGDATPEAIAGLLVKHGGTISIWDAEGGLFDKLSGLYSSGVSNLDTVLSAYSGDPISVERRGRDAEEIERPALTLCLMVQPVSLRKLVGDQEMTGRGLPARFLFTLPASMVGRRKTGRNVASIPAAVREAYVSNVAHLAIGMYGWTDPAVLQLSEAALDVLDAHEARTETRLGPGGDLEPTGAWGGKFDGKVVRLAGLLHLANLGPDKGTRSVIGPEIMTAATELGEFYAAHGRAVFAPAGAGFAGARTILTWLARNDVSTFTIRDAHTALKHHEALKAADNVRDALDTLAEHGWVAEVPAPPHDSRGRKPSPTFVAHPTAIVRK